MNKFLAFFLCTTMTSIIIPTQVDQAEFECRFKKPGTFCQLWGGGSGVCQFRKCNEYLHHNKQCLLCVPQQKPAA